MRDVPIAAGWADRAGKMAWGLLAVQIGVAALGVAYWRWEAAGNGSFETGRGLQPGGGGGPFTIETGYRVAEPIARAWSPAARLMAVSMQFDWPPDVATTTTDVPPTGWMIYTFAAPQTGGARGEGARTLSLVIDRQRGGLLGQGEEGWAKSPARSLSKATYPISSNTAILAAELTAGTAYRRACPSFRHLTRVTLATLLVPGSARDRGTPDAPDSSEQVFWIVTYEDARTPSRHDVEVRVNVVTGETSPVLTGPDTCQS